MKRKEKTKLRNLLLYLPDLKSQLPAFTASNGLPGTGTEKSIIDY